MTCRPFCFHGCFLVLAVYLILRIRKVGQPEFGFNSTPYLRLLTYLSYIYIRINTFCVTSIYTGVLLLSAGDFHGYLNYQFIRWVFLVASLWCICAQALVKHTYYSNTLHCSLCLWLDKLLVSTVTYYMYHLNTLRTYLLSLCIFRCRSTHFV